MLPRPTSHHLATTFHSVLSSSSAVGSLKASTALFLADATQVCSRHPEHICQVNERMCQREQWALRPERGPAFFSRALCQVVNNGSNM